MEDHKPRPCQPRPWKAEQKSVFLSPSTKTVPDVLLVFGVMKVMMKVATIVVHAAEKVRARANCPAITVFLVSNHCHLPPATGFGKQLMRRFYYDWKTDGCHELHYTGIGGNENSYMTYESCETACRGNHSNDKFSNKQQEPESQHQRSSGGFQPPKKIRRTRRRIKMARIRTKGYKLSCVSCMPNSSQQSPSQYLLPKSPKCYPAQKLWRFLAILL